MNIPYWRLSGFYFFYFAALGGFTPYWGLYLKDNGFDTVAIGELFALLVGTKIVAPNIWGWLADHTQRGMLLVRITSLLATLLFAAFLYVDGYAGYALVTIGFGFFWNAALPQFEAVTLFHLKDQVQRYSQVRLWGTIGFIAAVLGGGELIASQPLIGLPIAIMALLALMSLLALWVPETHPHGQEQQPAGLGRLIGQPEIIAFFIVGILVQIAHAPYYFFYSIYLQQHHYSATWTGGLWALGGLAEIVLFLLIKRVLACFSLRAILLSCLALAALRWLMIAWCADYLAALVVAQLLHAATFGGTHVASIHLVHRYFGYRHQGQGQAFYGSLCYGLGGMVGSFYGGYYWETMGATFVYSIGAAACIVAWLIAYVWIGRQRGVKPALR